MGARSNFPQLKVQIYHHVYCEFRKDRNWKSNTDLYVNLPVHFPWTALHKWLLNVDLFPDPDPSPDPVLVVRLGQAASLLPDTTKQTNM